MALTLRSNGNNPINIVSAQWFNDFLNALTGVMTDQPYTLNYRPASSTSTPTLGLETNGNAPLLIGYNSSSANVFEVDQSGVTYGAHFETNVVGNGNNWLWLYRAHIASGATVNKDWIQIYTGQNGTYLLYNNTDAIHVLEAWPSGQVTFANGNAYVGSGGDVRGTSVFDNGSRVAIQGAHSAGQPIVSYGSGTPGTLSVNEVYFQVS